LGSNLINNGIFEVWSGGSLNVSTLDLRNSNLVRLNGGTITIPSGGDLYNVGNFNPHGDFQIGSGNSPGARFNVIAGQTEYEYQYTGVFKNLDSYWVTGFQIQNDLEDNSMALEWGLQGSNYEGAEYGHEGTLAYMGTTGEIDFSFFTNNEIRFIIAGDGSGVYFYPTTTFFANLWTVGNIGVGQTTASARLHMAGGTTGLPQKTAESHLQSCLRTSKAARSSGPPSRWRWAPLWTCTIPSSVKALLNIKERTGKATQATAAAKLAQGAMAARKAVAEALPHGELRQHLGKTGKRGLLDNGPAVCQDVEAPTGVAFRDDGLGV